MLCELLVGVALRKDVVKTRKRLDVVLQVVHLWPIDLEPAGHYADAYHELKKAGRALSQVDIIPAAMSRHLNTTLFTTDRDFEALADILTENWLASN